MLLVVLATLPGCRRSSKPSAADVIIYGGTPAGVCAAFEAGRMGRSVILIEPTRHLGGMMSNGLGFTDYVPRYARVVSGLAHEFFVRNGHRYGAAIQYNLEPHVAETVFEGMAVEAQAAVIRGHAVTSVKKEKNRIVSVTTNNGRTYAGQVFIDASYEGDLVALAGVSCTVGRESAAQYGESLAGIQPLWGLRSVCPYAPGTMILLPFVQPAGDLTPGGGDRHVQAYNYRICVTNVPSNRVPIPPPTGYREDEYALLAETLKREASEGVPATLRSLLKIDALPAGKFDVNDANSVVHQAADNGRLSTDLVGYNDGYPEGTAEQRAAYAADLRRYDQGLLYFLGHSDAVPADVRREWLNYGLCRDEFQDNGNWPRQVYARETRRLVSGYVITQADVFGQKTASEPVALAFYYGADSHWVRRMAVNGQVRLEGSFFAPIPKPFGIDYGSIVPRAAECSNLIVPVCLSATHVAYSVIRMEVTLMMLGQAAGAAASLAVEKGSSVQDADSAPLFQRLVADGLVLRW